MTTEEYWNALKIKNEQSKMHNVRYLERNTGIWNADHDMLNYI